ncbi:hypothetical protein Taro_049857 [Colocasia esculenta]|uniref:Uncharacterized protein n=1 Tax=Colocasia esculenta TaxID=4460 RepID=A0A843XBX0_COLES|nr:hypothetical protein [Colocasia esculenta]
MPHVRFDPSQTLVEQEASAFPAPPPNSPRPSPNLQVFVRCLFFLPNSSSGAGEFVRLGFVAPVEIGPRLPPAARGAPVTEEKGFSGLKLE